MPGIHRRPSKPPSRLFWFFAGAVVTAGVAALAFTLLIDVLRSSHMKYGRYFNRPWEVSEVLQSQRFTPQDALGISKLLREQFVEANPDQHSKLILALGHESAHNDLLDVLVEYVNMLAIVAESGGRTHRDVIEALYRELEHHPDVSDRLADAVKAARARVDPPDSEE